MAIYYEMNDYYSITLLFFMTHFVTKATPISYIDGKFH